MSTFTTLPCRRRFLRCASSSVIFEAPAPCLENGGARWTTCCVDVELEFLATEDREVTLVHWSAVMISEC